jgi:hypothetical protein
MQCPAANQFFLYLVAQNIERTVLDLGPGWNCYPQERLKAGNWLARAGTRRSKPGAARAICSILPWFEKIKRKIPADVFFCPAE